MKNVAVRLPNVPGALGRLGATLGAAGVSLEGGGVFADGTTALANFLVEDGERAAAALVAAGFEHVRLSNVLIRRLDQGGRGSSGRSPAGSATQA